MTFTVPLSPFQTGMAVAQKRSRERFQSGAWSMFLAKRPCLRCAGNQLMFSFWASMRGLLPWMSKNQLGMARYIILCLERGLKGYSCWMWSIRQTAPASFSIFAMNLLDAQTSIPVSSVSRTPMARSWSAVSGR